MSSEQLSSLEKTLTSPAGGEELVLPPLPWVLVNDVIIQFNSIVFV